MNFHGRILIDWFEKVEYKFSLNQFKNKQIKTSLRCICLFLDTKSNKNNKDLDKFLETPIYDNLEDLQNENLNRDNLNVYYAFFISNFNPQKDLIDFDSFGQCGDFIEHINSGNNRIISSNIVLPLCDIENDNDILLIKKTKEIIRVLIPNIDIIWDDLHTPKNYITILSKNLFQK